MALPGQPDDEVVATTGSGEYAGSSVQHVVQGRIRPSAGPGVTFDPLTMWHSAETSTGWVSLELDFPVEVTLDQIGVHSQHSGAAHAATGARVEAYLGGAPVVVGERIGGLGVDDVVGFPSATAQRWRLSLQAGESGMVVIRGLELFHDGLELFPPRVIDPG